MRLSRFSPLMLRRDTLLRRLLVLYAAAIVAVVLCGAGVIAFAVWPHYEALERREADHRLRAVLQAVQSEQDRLQELVNTNAVWEEMFAFAQGQNPTFPTLNFAPDALRQIGVDAVVVLNNAGEAQFEGGQGDFNALLTMTRRALSNAPALRLGAAEDSQTALLRVGSDIAVVSERRIVRADGSGPSPAVLIFVRRIGPDVLARMHALTGTEFQLLADEVGRAPIGQARASAVLPDAHGRESIRVSVLGAQEVLAVGKTTILTLVLAAAIMLLALGALFALALSYAVISPVKALRARPVR
jgi:sensor domain CHASE-containing protein